MKFLHFVKNQKEVDITGEIGSSWISPVSIYLLRRLDAGGL
ncbi:hypothetical protein [Evansella vedderi]|nr:hypothetical protein [Evansella vedderi]